MTIVLQIIQASRNYGERDLSIGDGAFRAYMIWLRSEYLELAWRVSVGVAALSLGSVGVNSIVPICIIRRYQQSEALH